MPSDRKAADAAPIIHPATGEVVEDTLDVLERAEAYVDETLRALGPMYEYRRQLRKRIAELRGPAELPRPRWRTDRQQRVAECPRCGHHEAAA